MRPKRKSTASGLSPRGRGNLLDLLFSCCGFRSIPAWAGEPRLGTGLRRGGRVYPRVGGGTFFDVGGHYHGLGLSPRGRGNRCQVNRRQIERGSIPAWAGEPMPESVTDRPTTVYPRVGGGTVQGKRRPRPGSGLSPRGRGNLLLNLVIPIAVGSIPAWAGEPPPCDSSFNTHWVYPRVGGGTLPTLGVSPQLIGLSPRGRGNLKAIQARERIKGSIPAWAGEPFGQCAYLRLSPVYPRVGGGTYTCGHYTGAGDGLSPRGRGNPMDVDVSNNHDRSIPAWAGEPLFCQYCPPNLITFSANGI